MEIDRITAVKKILQAGDNEFTVKFKKLNGEKRTMRAVLEKTDRPEYTNEALLTVHDLDLEDFRTVNLSTIKKLTIGGLDYKVR